MRGRSERVGRSSFAHRTPEVHRAVTRPGGKTCKVEQEFGVCPARVSQLRREPADGWHAVRGDQSPHGTEQRPAGEFLPVVTRSLFYLWPEPPPSATRALSRRVIGPPPAPRSCG